MNTIIFNIFYKIVEELRPPTNPPIRALGKCVLLKNLLRIEKILVSSTR